MLDYAPAPGQFVNILPEYSPGDTPGDMIEKAAASLNAGREISLGAWGGSVTIHLLAPVENIAGPDLRVCGNAILSGMNAQGMPYGSGEPGIVEVMRDENGNGLPDDIWYTLKGEAYDDAVDCSVAYTLFDDSDDIEWTAAYGAENGMIPHIASFHAQPYFPMWIDGRTITVAGKRLPDNGVYNAATGRFDLYCLSGYADSFPDTDEQSALDIDNAVDGDGNAVKLSSIDFLRVTTGVLQVNGPLGECSTEISGVEVPVF
ncbi:MAG: PKD domain-containing protein [Muribaculaceae bacterium]|nr:PKD domain-containing protein [Muribaculaceae bacterium]